MCLFNIYKETYIVINHWIFIILIIYLFIAYYGIMVAKLLLLYWLKIGEKADFLFRPNLSYRLNRQLVIDNLLVITLLNDRMLEFYYKSLPGCKNSAKILSNYS